MLDNQPTLRVALLGLPGAGKSVSAGLLRTVLSEMGYGVAVVKLAAPLYEVQGYFYERMGEELPEGQQDGTLLNFLGSHFRKSSPGFLAADFTERCAAAVLSGADALLCDDARPADVASLAEQGFVIVRVTAPDSLRRLRKSGRGDRTAGDDAHPTESGIDAVSPDHTLNNSGSFSGLHARVIALAKTLTAEAEQAAGAGGGGVTGRYAIDALVRRASATVSRRYAENRHQIGAAILAGDGRIFTGLHVEAMVGRASVCAEAVALGKAREAGAVDLRLVLAVRHPKPSEAHREIRVVPPCGLCRELLLDYSQDIHTVIEGRDGTELLPLSRLLPHKYVGTKWTQPDPSGTGE